jgi:membrane peptidoglycan carboxypeptidase
MKEHPVVFTTLEKEAQKALQNALNNSSIQND